jgi:hypothetical protein
MSDDALLIVHRDGGWNDVLRAYRIVVDGREVGGVRRKGEIRVPLEPGVHTVEAKVDWCGSPPVTVAAGPGEQVELLVRNGLEGWRAFLVFVTVFWRTDQYLELVHVSGGGRPPQRPRR